jgi:L-amino acid N-acyltransferase YncA
VRREPVKGNRPGRIVSARGEHGARLAEIYNHYVTDSTVTFEERCVSGADMTRRIEQVHGAGLPWLVGLDARERWPVAYAYATPWRARSAYRFSVETTVYVDASETGRGHGSQLCRALLAQLRLRQLRIAVAGITLPNPASVALHERLGMRKVAHFHHVGYKFGTWLDVGYWQLDLRPTAPDGTGLSNDA